MKKKLLIFTVAAAITALTACTGGTNKETENVSPVAEPETEAITSEIADIEESTENIDIDETENDEEAGIATKFVNGTGKTMENFSIKLQNGSVGLGVIEDGNQITKKIEAVEKDAKIVFVIDGEETRLALEDGFQGSKIVINSDGNDGYVISYEGIEE